MHEVKILTLKDLTYVLLVLRTYIYPPMSNTSAPIHRDTFIDKDYARFQHFIQGVQMLRESFFFFFNVSTFNGASVQQLSNCFLHEPLVYSCKLSLNSFLKRIFRLPCMVELLLRQRTDAATFPVTVPSKGDDLSPSGVYQSCLFARTCLCTHSVSDDL